MTTTPGPAQPMPDDERLPTDHPVWDEADRPHVSPQGADGAPSPRGRVAAQSLVDVHDALRGQLEQIRGLVRRAAVEPAAAAEAREMLNHMAMRAQRWATGASCAAYCRLVAQHHFGEDTEIFPLLRGRDARLAAVLDRLESEHVVIHELLDAVDTALVRLVSGRGGGDLAAVVDRLAGALLSHLAYEERELLAPMARVFG